MSTTMLHRLADWAKATPKAPAQRYRVKGKGDWKTLTAQDYLDRVFYLACYLESCGIGPGKTGAILSYNSPEWAQTELALILARAKSAGLYPNSSSKDIHYVLNHCEAACLIVQNKDYFNKIVADGGTVPETIRFIISIDGDTSFSPKAVGYDTAISEGRKIALGRKVEEMLSKLDPLEASFMIYTSGTTGNPKGALLSQDNLVFTSDLIIHRWKLPAAGGLFSFLPLSHIAEKLHSIGVGISQRYVTTYCSKFEMVGKELPDAEPTLLLCVPRVWEKMMEGVISKIEKGTGPKKALALWALGVGERLARAKYSGQFPNVIDLASHPIADRLVLSKVRSALGLGKAQLAASGAAPLSAHVARWFRSIGLEIYEDYGSTETTGVVTTTIPGIDCVGTVGKPLEGCEFKLAEDGEILSRGRHVFLGYLKDEVNTRDALKDGWYYTGDVGAWTDTGLLKIVGRKKEIMKTSGGKMIAPVPIEEKLKEASFISQVCIVGDNRKFLSALVTLSESALADLNGPGSQSFKDGVLCETTMIKRVQSEFDRVNKSLASFEQVKQFTVLDREFSIPDGEMTPTMKMKRAAIETRFRALIDRMYNG